MALNAFISPYPLLKDQPIHWKTKIKLKWTCLGIREHKDKSYFILSMFQENNTSTVFYPSIIVHAKFICAWSQFCNNATDFVLKIKCGFKSTSLFCNLSCGVECGYLSNGICNNIGKCGKKKPVKPSWSLCDF